MTILVHVFVMSNSKRLVSFFYLSNPTKSSHYYLIWVVSSGARQFTTFQSKSKRPERFSKAKIHKLTSDEHKWDSTNISTTWQLWLTCIDRCSAVRQHWCTGLFRSQTSATQVITEPGDWLKLIRCRDLGVCRQLVTTNRCLASEK